jgi:hypothetical protein
MAVIFKKSKFHPRGIRQVGTWLGREPGGGIPGRFGNWLSEGRSWYIFPLKFYRDRNILVKMPSEHLLFMDKYCIIYKNIPAWIRCVPPDDDCAARMAENLNRS